MFCSIIAISKINDEKVGYTIYLQGLQKVSEDAKNRKLRGRSNENLRRISVPAAVQSKKASFPPDMSERVEGTVVVMLVAYGYALRRL